MRLERHESLLQGTTMVQFQWLGMVFFSEARMMHV
jgi:hypothetical protein